MNKSFGSMQNVRKCSVTCPPVAVTWSSFAPVGLSCLLYGDHFPSLVCIYNG